MKYDILVLGSGPGGYVTAIRASQLGMKVAVVEREALGGICLNWGCIPTKALLKSANVFEYIEHAEDYGIKVSKPKVDFGGMVSRSRGVADGMSKGVQFLMKKNKIDVIMGDGKLLAGRKVEVTDTDGSKQVVEADHIIIATGARSRQLPNLPQDGKKIIGYREAMTMAKQPKKMVVVGSGAIGVEFAYFYNAIGTKVTVVEYMPNIVPVEDEEVSKQLARSFKKTGINIMTSSEVTGVDTSGSGCKVHVKTKKGEETLEADVVLSAVGVVSNIDGIGLEEVGIAADRGVGHPGVAISIVLAQILLGLLQLPLHLEPQCRDGGVAAVWQHDVEGDFLRILITVLTLEQHEPVVAGVDQRLRAHHRGLQQTCQFATWHPLKLKLNHHLRFSNCLIHRLKLLQS